MGFPYFIGLESDLSAVKKVLLLKFPTMLKKKINMNEDYQKQQKKQ
jgi:hypothetical protein